MTNIVGAAAAAAVIVDHRLTSRTQAPSMLLCRHSRRTWLTWLTAWLPRWVGGGGGEFPLTLCVKEGGGRRVVPHCV